MFSFKVVRVGRFSRNAPYFVNSNLKRRRMTNDGEEKMNTIWKKNKNAKLSFGILRNVQCCNKNVLKEITL